MLTPPAALLALLFASGEPLEKKDVSKLLSIKESDLPVVYSSVSDSLKGLGLVLIESADELELRTDPEASVFVQKLRESELTRDLGKASLETLAVIAYQTGTTRGEIDWVRGVNSSASLRTLLMRGLITAKDDAKDKRRLHYALTTEALAHLGISRIEDLPRASELGRATRQIIEEESARVGSVEVQA